jgi:uncharacterized protein HemX
MKVRYTIRDMLLWAAVVALAVGWLTDHRRQEEIIKLQDAVEQRQHQQIGDTQQWIKGTQTAFRNQINEIREVQKAVEKLTSEIHLYFAPNDEPSKAGN